MSEKIHERLRELLCDLGDTISGSVISGRKVMDCEQLSTVAVHAGGDTIYAVDKIGEEAILAWFDRKWPADLPVQIVMEGLEDDLCFPAGTPVNKTDWKCIIDPIDGTRGLMYEKRSAWALAGVAPQNGPETMLSQIVATAMTEIPLSRQWRSDQLSTTLHGPLVAFARDTIRGSCTEWNPRPSQATNFEHGFASLVKYFPEGRTLVSQIEERLWDEIIGLGRHDSPVVFDDQYISTGGQFYELAVGRDRMVGDIRPIVLRLLDMESQLVCHPYDACAWLILEKAGAVFEHPLGGFPDAPLDTESGVAWVGYANEKLASIARPVLGRILHQILA